MLVAENLITSSQRTKFSMFRKILDSPNYTQGLTRLREEMLKLYQLTSKQVEYSVSALMKGDIDLCAQVIAADEKTDDAEMRIAQLGFQLLSDHQPKGRDLRMIIGSMNVARTLERLADHSTQVAKRSRKILREGRPSEANLIEPVYSLAMQQLNLAGIAFFDKNVSTAERLAREDKALDKLHKRLVKSLSRMVEERQEGVAGLLHLIFVSRALERIGDLSVKIAEEVVFIELAEDVRHQN